MILSVSNRRRASEIAIHAHTHAYNVDSHKYRIAVAAAPDNSVLSSSNYARNLLNVGDNNEVSFRCYLSHVCVAIRFFVHVRRQSQDGLTNPAQAKIIKKKQCVRRLQRRPWPRRMCRRQAPRVQFKYTYK